MCCCKILIIIVKNKNAFIFYLICFLLKVWMCALVNVIEGVLCMWVPCFPSLPQSLFNTGLKILHLPPPLPTAVCLQMCVIMPGSNMASGYPNSGLHACCRHIIGYLLPNPKKASKNGIKAQLSLTPIIVFNYRTCCNCSGCNGNFA